MPSKKYYYIKLTCSTSCVTFWYIQNDLAMAANLGFCPQVWGFQCLSGFFFWRSGVFRI